MLFTTATILGLAALAGSAAAISKNGHYKVIINGVTYDPAPGKSAKADKLPATGIISVIGVHVTFKIDTATLGVYNYSLTGAPDSARMVTSPTVLFASKVATLSPAQLSGKTISKFEVRDEDFSMIFNTAAGKLKIQSKDGPQGGIFQMETEFSSNVEFTHTLGPSIFYFLNSVTGKINFGDGIDAVTPTQDPVNYHTMLLGKDSPQVAVKTYQDGSKTKWSVAPGGRLGGVLGEDATEIGAGPSSCTSHCQAQNRIRGSIPPQQDPQDPQPLKLKLKRWAA